MTPTPTASPVQHSGPAATPLVAASIALAAWVGALPLIWVGDTCTIAGAAVPIAGVGIYGACRLAHAFRFSILSQIVVGIGFYIFTMFAAAGRERAWLGRPPDACTIRVEAVAESIQHFKNTHGYIPETIDEVGYGKGFRCPSGDALVMERRGNEWMVYCPQHMKSRKNVEGPLRAEATALKR